MSTQYVQYPANSGTTVALYPDSSQLPSMAINGSLAIALDTGTLYEYNANTPAWQTIGPGADAGANATLSNLTSPTSINQDLLFGLDNTYDIGADNAHRPRDLWVARNVRFGTYPFDIGSGDGYFEFIPSTGFNPTLNIYAGGSDIINMTYDGTDLNFLYDSMYKMFDFGPGTFNFYGPRTNVSKFSMDANSNVFVGSGALATTATNGFLSIPTTPGTPTATPTLKTGLAPLSYDSTNSVFYVYDTGLTKWNPIGRSFEFNVKDYGAVGDGSANDTVAVQAAVAAAGNAGGVVYFPVGIYKITSQITVLSFVTLRGEGLASIIRSGTSGVNNLFYQNGANGNAYEGLVFYGVETTELGSTAITFDMGCTNFSVKNCYISGPSDTIGFNIGINILAGCNGIIDNCSLFRLIGHSSGNGYGVLVSNNSTGIKVNGSYIDLQQSGVQGGRHGIYMSSGTNNSSITNNTVKNTYYESITFNCLSATESQMYNIVCTNNTVDSSINPSNPVAVIGGISINGFIRGLVLSNNTISNSNSSGIVLQCEQSANFGTPTNGLVSNNIVTSSQKFGICCDGGSYNNITGNVVRDVSLGDAGTYSAILVGDNSEAAHGCGVGNTITGNFVQQSTGQMRAGIQILGSAANNYLGADNFIVNANYAVAPYEDSSGTSIPVMQSADLGTPGSGVAAITNLPAGVSTTPKYVPIIINNQLSYQIIFQ